MGLLDNRASDLYKIWAPEGHPWTEWASSTLFTASGLTFINGTVDIPQISWLPAGNSDTMVIVDLPGKQGVEEGLALAKLGFRPVPLYSGEDKANGLVDVKGIVAALFAGAEILKGLPLSPIAPPAFLLDSNRMSGGSPRSGKTDNRWSVFPQDMPAAASLSRRSIREIIVRSDILRDDLAHILSNYRQQGGIRISLYDGSRIVALNPTDVTRSAQLVAYKSWAPESSLWTEWAKPVVFATNSFLANANVDISQIDWLPERNSNKAVIVDLPGKRGVEEGLALAQLGFRPVPLYNGVNKPKNKPGMSNVDVKDIAAFLFAGAGMLRELQLSPIAPPAFLLDSNRMSGSGKDPGVYDNRWSIFPQDMPSAAFLLKHGIEEVIVRSEHGKIQDDLAHILYRYHEQKIKIFICDGSTVREASVSKPSWFKSLFYRFKIIMGLTRNPAGGFGELVPQSSGGGG